MFKCKTPCNIINAALGEYNASAVEELADITSETLNTAYPRMTIGGKVTYTNIADQEDKVVVFTKITGSTWAQHIDSVV